MLALLHKKYYDVFVKPILKNYLKKERWFSFQNLKLKIYPGVFHPAYFFSTLVFVDYINNLEFKNKNICEVGAGSGLLSFIAFSKGAHVCSFDISSQAVKGLIENFRLNFGNKLNFNIFESDLFDSIPKITFDYILINPPYFFNDPNSEADFSWYCGKNGQYFEKLFKQLGHYTNISSSVLMILADNCDIERIKQIAQKYKYSLHLEVEKKIKWEKNFIFKILQNQ